MTDATAPIPPVPERRPTRLEAHGDVRVDEWYWLRDRDDPVVLDHLRAENAHTGAATAHTAALQEALYDEIVARIEETDLSVPSRKGPWLYYHRTEEGKQYGIHCRRPAGGAGADEVLPPGSPPPADEQVILDENALAEGHGYFALGNLSVSPDHRWLVYSTDVTGGERYTLRVLDLDRGELSPEAIEDTSYGCAWFDDNATILYVRVDEAMRPHQLWRHRVGGDPAADTLVLEEPDEHFFLGVGRTRDDRFVVCALDSKTTSEVHVLDAGDPDGTFRPLAPRRPGVEYHVEHDRAGRDGTGRFLVTTNDGAPDFRLLDAPDDPADPSSWTEVLPHRPGVRLEGVDAFAGHLVVYERDGGESRARVVDRATGSSDPIAQPESPSTVWGAANPEYDSAVVRYEYTSLVTPRSVYDLDMAGGERRLRKRQPVLGDFDPTRYRTERRWVAAGDGVEVPVSLVWRADMVGEVPGANGPSPCLLYGYGSYEASMDPTFSSIRLSLLDRGFVYAIAHVRGGGELGRRWYEEGKLAAKPHTFSDFVACARALVDTGVTAPDRLVARGGSAGGLLMGAVANAAPDLFRAIVAEVPFVDCLTTMLDESIPLTVGEFEEWGDPIRDPKAYADIKAYSPYDNVGPGPHPAIFATGGLHDTRVGFWEPAKWVAKLRDADPDARVLYRPELSAGHGGRSGRYDAWRDEAFVMAWLLDALGVTGA